MSIYYRKADRNNKLSAFFVYNNKQTVMIWQEKETT